MNPFKNKELIPKLATYKLAKKGLVRTPKPIILTFSITSACQSLCKTCNIGRRYLKNPDIAKRDLTLEEIEKMFKSIGPVYFFNISGGEPFLRKDFIEIVKLAFKHLSPKVIHTPTNALMPKTIKEKTKETLKWMKENGYGDVSFTIKPSYDGIKDNHDEIRGIKGNFEKLITTYKFLTELKDIYPNLKVGLGTVISKFNINQIKEIADFAYMLKPDTYINEIAENRSELFNKEEDITPHSNLYKTAMKYFSEQTKQEMRTKKGISRAMYAFRQVYYNLTIEILKKNRQIIPCYGGISNVHINARGEVWPCCILGYSKPLGNLRDVEFNFYKIWHSKQAKEVRKFIHEKKCSCPLANQSYSNMLLHIPSLIKVLRYTFF